MARVRIRALRLKQVEPDQVLRWCCTQYCRALCLCSTAHGHSDHTWDIHMCMDNMYMYMCMYMDMCMYSMHNMHVLTWLLL